jgi:peptidyl-prolyl cis-trans isomerase SurA
LPKRSRVPPVIRPGSRKPTTRWDEERRGQLMAMVLGAAVVIAVAVIAVVGYYETKVRPKGETVLQVGSRSFNLDYVERRLRYDIQQGNTYYQSNPSQAVTFLLSEITQEELTRQGAPEKGVDISDAAIDAEIRSREDVPDNADQNTFAAAYRKAVHDSGLSTQGYRDVIAAILAQNALTAQFTDQAPKTADQVRFRVIVLVTEDDANTALQRLQNGEDFATVAKDISQDTSSKDNGGEQDWTPRAVLDPALGDALFSLPVGQISDIITGQNALFIVQVEERQDQRDTTDSQRSTLASLALQQWLSDLQDRLGVANSLNDGQRNSILQVLQDEVQKGQ